MSVRDTVKPVEDTAACALVTIKDAIPKNWKRCILFTIGPNGLVGSRYSRQSAFLEHRLGFIQVLLNRVCPATMIHENHHPVYPLLIPRSFGLGSRYVGGCKAQRVYPKICHYTDKHSTLGRYWSATVICRMKQRKYVKGVAGSTNRKVGNV